MVVNHRGLHRHAIVIQRFYLLEYDNDNQHNDNAHMGASLAFKGLAI